MPACFMLAPGQQTPGPQEGGGGGGGSEALPIYSVSNKNPHQDDKSDSHVKHLPCVPLLQALPFFPKAAGRELCGDVTVLPSTPPLLTPLTSSSAAAASFAAGQHFLPNDDSSPHIHIRVCIIYCHTAGPGPCHGTVGLAQSNLTRSVDQQSPLKVASLFPRITVTSQPDDLAPSLTLTHRKRRKPGAKIA